MIEMRLVGTIQEIEETLDYLGTIYEVHYKSPRQGRKGNEYLCYVNALIPRDHPSKQEIEELKAEITDLKSQLLAPSDAAILSPKMIENDRK